MKQLLLFFSLFCCLNIHAQTHRYKLDFSLSAKNFVDTIPIEYEGHQIYIPIYINGKKYRANLDTGCSQGIVYTDSPFSYVKKLGKIEVQDANGHRDSISAVRFPDFQLGHLTVSHYCGTLHTPVNRHRPYDLIIGFDLFNKGLCAKIDVAQKQLILTDRRDFFSLEGGHVMKYRLLRFVPHVKVSPYYNCSDEALFDSGSRRLYEMGQRSRRVFSEKFPDFSSQIEGTAFGSRSIGNFGAEKMSDIYFLWLDRLEWSTFAFLDYHTMTTQGYSRIGGEFFSYGSVLILPHRKQILFQPYGDPSSVRIGNEPTEITYVPVAGGVGIGMVREDSEYYRNGFRPGDVIISINGRRITSMAELQSYPFITGRQYTFTIRRGLNQMRDIVVTK